jgi:hypothetical protein
MSCLVSITIAAPYFFAPAPTLLLDAYFVSAMLLLLEASWMLTYLYDNFGRTPRKIQFYLGLCLMISSAFMFGDFEETARSMTHWEVLFRQDYPRISPFLIQFILYAKNVISFGFAAFGASVAANAIVKQHEHS